MAENNFYNNIPMPDDEQLLKCMHCGMCLPVCPTYDLTKMEKYSPRGRIRLIKAVAEGELDITPNFVYSLDFCLDCQACVTACPAGVEYGLLVEAAHYHIEEWKKERGEVPFIKRIALGWLFRNQSYLRLLGFFMRLYQLSGLQWLVQTSGLMKLFSPKMHNLSFMLPPIPKRQAYPEIKAADSAQKRNKKVGILTGCVQDIFFNKVNHDTIDVLAYNGYDVFTPQAQQCCGSVHGHNGDLSTAKQLARQMIDLFEQGNVDFVVVNSAGCGAFMKEYDQLLADDQQYAERAQRFVSKVKDITEFLVQEGYKDPQRPFPETVTYHEPCHLAHTQKIKTAPREIVQSVPGVKYIELPESDWCCGSAGVYNITHYDTSMELLARKIDNIRKTGAKYVVTGNPGCLIQLFYGKKKFNLDFELLHPVSLLHKGYFGENGKNNKGG